MIVNLTPHDVNFIMEDGMTVTFQSAGIARAKQTNAEAGNIEGFRIVRASYGEPEGLPMPEAGTYYIVSVLTAAAAKASGRTTDDLLLTADAVRNEAGQIVGCKAFALYE